MKRFDYETRFWKALEHRKINTIEELVESVCKRAGGNREVADKLLGLSMLIEPPRCQMDHCDDHTTYGFCCCRQHLEPTKCQKHREFIKRQQERCQKAYDEGRNLGEDELRERYKHKGYTLQKACMKGFEDQKAGKPWRNMTTGKLKLEYIHMTPETEGEFYVLADHGDYDVKRFILEFLEIPNYSLKRLGNLKGFDQYDNRQVITSEHRHWSKENIPLKAPEGFGMAKMRELFAESRKKKAVR